ncbi:NADPH-dependent FMN reductase [Nocardioides sp. T5]|uniref:NADPH-dependent FMN reductase n=1 Tax=Nocardioides sp. T5 TaxID=3400182 RepID=UPI003A8986EC
MTTTILVGNPKPASRTRHIAEAVAEVLGVGEADRIVIDLADHVDELFRWPSETMSALAETVTASDLLIVASPTYKATYTGLLKSFLDRFGGDALSGVTAVPVMTGASAGHSMAPDEHLRPLLVELGAMVPSRSLYFITEDMDRMDALVADWAGSSLAPIRATLSLTNAVSR